MNTYTSPRCTWKNVQLNSYDPFSLIYDPAISWLYRKHRAYAAHSLRLDPGSHVLVPGCGTGLDFEFLSPAVGPEGRVVGIDLSRGMLKRAEHRVRRKHWQNVQLKEGNARELDSMDLPPFDRILFFLTLSVLPDWHSIFMKAWERLEDGGRCAIFDVHASRRVPQSWIVESVARADVSRRTWEPLLELAPDARHEQIAGSPHIHGGDLHFCVGTKG